MVKDPINGRGAHSHIAKLEAEIKTLRKRLEANTRRIEELEATSFQLQDEEEVVLVTVPRRRGTDFR